MFGIRSIIAVDNVDIGWHDPHVCCTLCVSSHSGSGQASCQARLLQAMCTSTPSTTSFSKQSEYSQTDSPMLYFTSKLT